MDATNLQPLFAPNTLGLRNTPKKPFVANLSGVVLQDSVVWSALFELTQATQ